MMTIINIRKRNLWIYLNNCIIIFNFLFLAISASDLDIRWFQPPLSSVSPTMRFHLISCASFQNRTSQLDIIISLKNEARWSNITFQPTKARSTLEMDVPRTALITISSRSSHPYQFFWSPLDSDLFNPSQNTLMHERSSSFVADICRMGHDPEVSNPFLPKRTTHTIFRREASLSSSFLIESDSITLAESFEGTHWTFRKISQRSKQQQIHQIINIKHFIEELNNRSTALYIAKYYILWSSQRN
jgi:hypothetical protein